MFDAHNLVKLADSHWREALGTTSPYSSQQPGFALSARVGTADPIIIERGYASIEHSQIISANETRFHIASLAKQLTSYTVIKSLRDRQHDLSYPVYSLLHDIIDLPRTLSFGDLLRHRSGLPDLWDILEWSGWRSNDLINKTDACDAVARLTMTSKAVSFRYNNTGYLLAALAIERLTKQSFQTLTSTLIFNPLNMSQTFWRDDHTGLIPNRALGYLKKCNNTVLSDPNLAVPGPTSLWSTLIDFNRWTDALSSKDSSLDVHVMEDLMTPPVVGHYGYGFAFAETRVGPVRFHSGRDFGSSAITAYFPQIELGVTVFANLPALPTLSFVVSIADLLSDKPKAEPSWHKSTVQSEASFVTGIYSSVDGAVLFVEVDEDTVRFSGAVHAEMCSMLDGVAFLAHDTRAVALNGGLKIEGPLETLDFRRVETTDFAKPKFPRTPVRYYSRDLCRSIEVLADDGIIKLRFPKGVTKESRIITKDLVIFDDIWLKGGDCQWNVLSVNSLRSRNINFISVS